MKKITLWAIIAYFIIGMITTGCSQYTCPTYSGADQGPNKYNVGKAVMVKKEIHYNQRKL